MARALLWVSVVVVAVVLPETTADMVFQFHEADIALAKSECCIVCWRNFAFLGSTFFKPCFH